MSAVGRVGVWVALWTSVGCISPEQWRRDHCHYDGAYADGMNEARRGKPMSPQQFIGQCPVEIEAEVMDGYREGYTAGAQAAPISEPPAHRDDRAANTTTTATREPAPALSTAQWVCDNTLDCKGKGWCKDRGDGVKLCMKDGARGDYCTSTIDCGSGLWCKKGPAGLEVCM